MTRQLIILNPRPLSKASKKPKEWHGFSLPYALVIAVAVIASALAVTSRSTQGLFSSSFNQDTRRAREAAEIGATRIISELNREHNRPLLAMATGATSWGTALPAGTSNQCASLFNRTPKIPNLSSVYTGGASSSPTVPAAPPVVYISDNGEATSSSSATPVATSTTSKYAYRLNSITTPTLPVWTGSTANRGIITLNVSGFTYTGGRLSGSATIEQSVETIPKCCGLSLGANGNSSIGNDLRSCNEATGSRFGFVFSTALTDDGSTVFNGADSELGIVGGTGNVDTVSCLGSATSTCPADVRVGIVDIPVNQVNTTLKQPSAVSATYSYPNSLYHDTATYPPQPCSFTGGGSLNCNNIATVVNSNLAVIDAERLASITPLPSNCRRATLAGITTINCNISSLDLSGGGGRTLRVLTTNSTRIKLHFPNEGQAINIGSGSDLQHCTKLSGSTSCNTTTSTANPLQRFQVFGCAQNPNPDYGCLANGNTTNPNPPQSIQLRGNSSVAGEEPFFIYAPVASTTISGGGAAGDQFSGVIWTNRFTGNGNVEILVPGSGVGDLLDEFASDGGAPAGSGPRPFVFEYIARAIRQFKILPGT